jgi:membrane-associated phospholipid phosphatase
MNSTLAKILSVVFQPLMMPFIGTLIVFNLSYFEVAFLSQKVYWFILSSTLLFTFLLPISMIVIFKKFGMIGNLSMDKKEERHLPVLITGILFAMNYYILKNLPLPNIYFSFLLASIVTLIFCLLVTYKWKISMHMAGLGGLCGALLVISFFWQINLTSLLVIFILLSGATGTARIVLNAHSPAQVYAGFFAGVLPQLLVAFGLFFSH